MWAPDLEDDRNRFRCLVCTKTVHHANIRSHEESLEHRRNVKATKAKARTRIQDQPRPYLPDIRGSLLSVLKQSTTRSGQNSADVAGPSTADPLVPEPGSVQVQWDSDVFAKGFRSTVSYDEQLAQNISKKMQAYLEDDGALDFGSDNEGDAPEDEEEDDEGVENETSSAEPSEC